MKRHVITPRPNWEEAVLRDGLAFHSTDGQKYWDESVCYQLTAAQVDELEEAGNEVHQMALQAIEKVVHDDRLMDRFGIPKQMRAYVRQTWEEGHPEIYGRFDFAYDGINPPKLLEYNADTPTSLLEASVVQWNWKEDVKPQADQFNSIHESLVEQWRKVAGKVKGKPVHFACMQSVQEDVITTDYMQAVATEAGIDTHDLDLKEIGFDPKRNRFDDGRRGVPIEFLFKLYPWEMIAHEAYAGKFAENKIGVLEPAWEMIRSNKALMPLLWEMFPNNKYLLPAYHTPDKFVASHTPYVKKPLLGREGANVTIVDQFNHTVAEADGPYGTEGYVYQQRANIPHFEGNTPMLGVWMAGDKACGLGIREEHGDITTNQARFVPHFFMN